MTTDFKKLKASGKATLAALQKKVKEMKDTKRSDDRFWTPTVDKAGNGFAVIRFLPAPPGEPENQPWIRIWDHGFQGPGGWYIENSRTSLGTDENPVPDPVSEYNSKLWNSTTDEKSPEREQARKQKRRLHYISNILVITDPGNPDNEGKVFLFKFGKKIFDKIEDCMKFDELEPDKVLFSPFDLDEGAHFRLRIRNVEGYRNYDKSEFDKPSPLYNDFEKEEALWRSEYPLQPFIAPENFKSYDELKAKLTRVLAGSDADEAPVARRATDHEELAPKSGKTKSAPQTPQDDIPWNEDEDDEMKYFKSLAN